MKKGERFKLDATWWQKNKASTLKADQNLGVLLKRYEDEKKALENEPTKSKYKSIIKTLGDIGATAKAVADKCNTTVQAETKATLLTAPFVVAAESTPVAKAAAEYQHKLAEATREFVPLTSGAKKLTEQAEELQKLLETFKAALGKQSRMAAEAAFREFNTYYKKVTLVGHELEEVFADNQTLWQWAKDLSTEDGHEILTAMQQIQHGITVLKTNKVEQFKFITKGEELIDRKFGAA